MYVIEAYGTAERQLHSLFILASGNSGQLHTPAALLPGISASVLNQQEAGGTLSQSWGGGGLEVRKIAWLARNQKPFLGCTAFSVVIFHTY